MVGKKRTRAVSIEDDGRAEPCHVPKMRQSSNRAANRLVAMSTATPFWACRRYRRPEARGHSGAGG